MRAGAGHRWMTAAAPPRRCSSSYLRSEAADLHDALDGEEDGEDEIAVGQEVGVVQGGAVVLKWNGDRTVKVVTKTAYM